MLFEHRLGVEDQMSTLGALLIWLAFGTLALWSIVSAFGSLASSMKALVS